MGAMTQLFQDDQPPAPADGAVVAVAVNANVWRSFDYRWPASLGTPQVGMRVRVPFGRGDRKTLGFITDARGTAGDRKLKAVAEVLDAEPQFDSTLWKLGEWISHYYLTPPGQTLAAMVPSAVGRHADKSETVVYLLKMPPEWPSSLGGRQKRAVDELFEARKQGVEPLSLESLLHHSGASRDTIRRLAQRELIRLESRPVRLGEGSAGLGDSPAVTAVTEAPFALNEDQQAVLTALESCLGDASGGSKFSVTLLHGVTGSGKTEVYIRAIRRIVEQGKQAILMAPEIALATQTLQRLLERLPRVAVLHSALGDAQRAFYYQQIRDGHAAVVVGPRSAIFAPTRKLGLIIVDEEHEPSYKQDTAPRYHARDVAVMRASLAGVPILLGSATPSMESIHNVELGRYGMLRLPRRVRGLPMPKLQIVSLRKEMQPGRIELIGRTLTLKIASALDSRRQIILLMNRRGYASYVFCPSCQWILMCEHCSHPMVYHQATRLAMCHQCNYTCMLPEHCPVEGGKLLLFGYGVQRIEGELLRKFPQARVARMDSDTMTSPAQFQNVFRQMAAGEVDILLGTQMVAKGLDFPGVLLVGVASADTSLAIPDFRSSERTFQLIVQVAGRAGRGTEGGEVVVQTLHEDEPTIQLAARHDFDGFAARELPLRKEMSLPPYWRMVRFIVRHEKQDKAQQAADDLAVGLRELLPAEKIITIGPQPAGVARINNQYRFHILLRCATAGLIQQRIFPRMETLCKQLGAEVLADADPMNLL